MRPLSTLVALTYFALAFFAYPVFAAKSSPSSSSPTDSSTTGNSPSGDSSSKGSTDSSNSKSSSGDIGLLDSESDLVSYTATVYSMRSLVSELKTYFNGPPPHSDAKTLKSANSSPITTNLIFNCPLTSPQIVDLIKNLQDIKSLTIALQSQYIANGKILRHDNSLHTQVYVGPAISGATSITSEVAGLITSITGTIHSLSSSRTAQGERISVSADNLNRILLTALLADHGSQNNPGTPSFEVYDFTNCVFTLDETQPLGPDGKALPIMQAYQGLETQYQNLLSDQDALNQRLSGSPAPSDEDKKQIQTDVDSTKSILGQTKVLLDELNGLATAQTSNNAPVNGQQTGDQTIQGTAGDKSKAGDNGQNGQDNNSPQTPQNNGASNPPQSSVLATLAYDEFLLAKLKQISQISGPPDGSASLYLVSVVPLAVSTSQMNLIRFIGEDQSTLTATSIIQLQVSDLLSCRQRFSKIVASRGYELYQFSKARDETRLGTANHDPGGFNPPRAVSITTDPFDK